MDKFIETLIAQLPLMLTMIAGFYALYLRTKEKKENISLSSEQTEINKDQSRVNAQNLTIEERLLLTRLAGSTVDLQATVLRQQDLMARSEERGIAYLREITALKEQVTGLRDTLEKAYKIISGLQSPEGSKEPKEATQEAVDTVAAAPPADVAAPKPSEEAIAEGNGKK